MPENLIDELPSGLEEAVTALLSPGEVIHVKIKGAYKEALVCTDRRVLIVKKGFMTGQTLGGNSFQQSYQSVAGAQVKFGALSGYFEVSAGGMQNTDKSYWSTKKGTDPSKAANCVSLNSKRDADRFREAVSFIMERIHSLSMPAAAVAAPSDGGEADAIIASIKKLGELRDAGVLTDNEFDAKKAELLSRL
ncbi:SHOCT domain-containing protein [Leifsonia sp. McL0607]|uniref:SHOCT domain-containing protein n=1 Tax=Leifsonia sp. McL0607 TaxID=3415672 RepID=UPI003CF20E1C